MIDQSTKQLIKDELNKFVSHTGSAKKASVPLQISNGTISNVLNGKDEMISDEMWRRLASGLKIKIDERWIHVDTKPFQALKAVINNSKLHTHAFCATTKPGSVKTHTLEWFKANLKDVYYVKCNRHTTERDFLSELLVSMKRRTNNYRSADMLKEVVAQIKQAESPVIIVDEFEKVKPDTFLLSIDLYNAIEELCGLVFLGTPNLKTKVENGVDRGKLGYNEFKSRVGKIIEIPANDHDDAAMVIRAQGLTEDDTMTVKGKMVNAIDYIISESDDENNAVDMRSVKRKVHVFKQKKGLANA